MPLIKSTSPAAFKTNVRTLMGEVGKSPRVQSREQALAIAYSTARRAGKAYGGRIHKQDGGELGIMPALHREYLARHGGETADQGISPTVTGPQLKAMGASAVDPFGIPSALAKTVAPGFGQRWQDIENAEPEAAGAGAMISPLNDIPGALIGKGIGMASRAAQTYPKLAAGLGAAGLTATGASAAGEGEPAPTPTIDENDPELQKRLSALGPKPQLQKEQQDQIDKLQAKIAAESKLQATAERRIPQGDKEKDDAYAKRKAADPRVAVHVGNIADLRSQITGIGGQVAKDQDTWSQKASDIRSGYAQELAELQRKQAPFATREPEQQKWFDRAPWFSLGTGYAAGRGLSALSRGAPTAKKLASTVGLAGLAGFGESLYGAGEPARQDFLQPRESGARKQLDVNVRDPGWWASKGLEVGEGTLAGALGSYYGAKGPVSRMFAPTAHEAVTTTARRLFGLPTGGAPAADQAIQTAVNTAKRSKPWPVDASGKRVWPTRSQDVEGLNHSGGQWRDRFGHVVPEHLRPAAPTINSPPANSIPAEARGGGISPYGYAGGGMISPFETRMAARGLLHEGQINSVVPGRTDKLPITVGGGAYVLPADHLAAIGQGNSAAGANIMNRMLKMGPYGAGASPMARIRPNIPHISSPPLVPRSMPHFAPGGTPQTGHGVPIIAAGGEFVIPPDKVAEIGGGDVDRGHKILDHWVMSTRREHIQTLRNLKPPKKD